MKRVLLILAIVTALAIPLTAYAATSDAPAAKAVRNFCGLDTSQMTEQQKADMVKFREENCPTGGARGTNSGSGCSGMMGKGMGGGCGASATVE